MKLSVVAQVVITLFLLIFKMLLQWTNLILQLQIFATLFHVLQRLFLLFKQPLIVALKVLKRMAQMTKFCNISKMLLNHTLTSIATTTENASGKIPASIFLLLATSVPKRQGISLPKKQGLPIPKKTSSADYQNSQKSGLQITKRQGLQSLKKYCIQFIQYFCL